MSAPNERVRVLIADSDYMGSQLMASALNRYRNDFEVVGISSTAQETIRKVEAARPHVAILGSGLRDGNRTGIALLEKLRGIRPKPIPIMLLHSLDRETVIDAFCGGARGIISRGDSFQALAKCIRCVHSGQIWANNQQIEYLVEALPQMRPRLHKSGGISSLTAREQAVTQLLVEGLKNREIAQALHVTEHTISNYLHRIFDKLGVSSRVQLILFAMSNNTAVTKSDAA
jgi:two-component system, NarL family, nitrate/nitrite response regulator NarL